MKTKFVKTIGAGCIVLLSASCEKDQIKTLKNASDVASASAQMLGSWENVFIDDFDNTDNFKSKWERTNRPDHNSSICLYDPNVPTLGSYDGRSVLVLTATPYNNVYKSGHVKSFYSFKPGINEEYRVSAQIKLIAMDGANYKGFNQTYGAWPAFWTVQENEWPKQGEIDIMEGYSFSPASPYFACNLFYGDSVGDDDLHNIAETNYTAKVNENWHLYDEYWKNEGGNVTVTIMVDNVIVATYSDAAYHLDKFGPHNIILNLNVGSTKQSIFDNSRINLFSKTMMWVDYVTVDRRTL
jgi:hypothetical protein